MDCFSSSALWVGYGPAQRPMAPPKGADEERKAIQIQQMLPQLKKLNKMKFLYEGRRQSKRVKWMNEVKAKSGMKSIN